MIYFEGRGEVRGYLSPAVSIGEKPILKANFIGATRKFCYFFNAKSFPGKAGLNPNDEFRGRCLRWYSLRPVCSDFYDLAPSPPGLINSRDECRLVKL